MKNKKNNKSKFKVFIYLLAICLACVVLFMGFDRLPAFIDEMTTSAESSAGKSKLKLSEQENPDFLVLVNSKNTTGNRDKGLVSIYSKKTSSYLVKDKNVLIDERIMPYLNDMMDDFYRETGKRDVNVISGYRSVETQEELFKKITLQNGSLYAKRFCQKPGSSEHHTGLALDFSIYHSSDGTSEDFKGQGDYSWFYDNSWKYGFIRRYDESKEDITGIGYEPWHFRYVGKKEAKYMKKHNLCLEEYVEQINSK